MSNRRSAHGYWSSSPPAARGLPVAWPGSPSRARARLGRVVAVGDVVLGMLAGVDPGAGRLLLGIALAGGRRRPRARRRRCVFVDGHARASTRWRCASAHGSGGVPSCQGLSCRRVVQVELHHRGCEFVRVAARRSGAGGLLRSASRRGLSPIVRMADALAATPQLHHPAADAATPTNRRTSKMQFLPAANVAAEHPVKRGTRTRRSATQAERRADVAHDVEQRRGHDAEDQRQRPEQHRDERRPRPWPRRPVASSEPPASTGWSPPRQRRRRRARPRASSADGVIQIAAMTFR